ncbi:hypothetical protein SNE40_005576 [Patella caerulea]|uniref:Aminoacyl tRNA synthase complex-interacting multifunctional protein 2 n=1 Tax=Patella caerulea TaxID=87958 RepID=A0AAN8K3M1_PATCE
MGNIFSRLRQEVQDVVRNCRAREEEEDVKTIISNYSTLERDRRKCAEKSPNVHLQRFDSDTGEEWKSLINFSAPSRSLSHSSPCMEGGISKSDISSLCSTPLNVPVSQYSLTANIPSSRESSSYNLFHDLNTSFGSDSTEIFTKAGLRARYTLLCPDKESIHENIPEKQSSEESGDPLKGLETRQDEVLKRLGVLQSRVGQLQEKYSISTCTSSTPSKSAVVPTAMEKGKFHDIVIYLDPSSIPYSLFVLYEDLRKQFNVLATTHVHSSVLDVPGSLINIFNNGEVKSRKDYQIGLTVIWKKVNNGAVLMVDPYKQSAIEGEVNIARYLQRLLNSQYDSQDIIEATQIDEWVDTAQIQYLDGSNKERAAVLRSLNSRFGKNSWLVGDRCSLADITMWSVLQQSGQVTDVPANVKKWLTACNNQPGFSSALKLVS